MASGTRVLVTVHANKITLPGYTGFVEDNGFVSINATNFTRHVNYLSNEWKVIDGLGYAGKAKQAFPLSVNFKSFNNTDPIRLGNAFVNYDFYTFSPASPFVTIFAFQPAGYSKLIVTNSWNGYGVWGMGQQA